MRILTLALLATLLSPSAAGRPDLSYGECGGEPRRASYVRMSWPERREQASLDFDCEAPPRPPPVQTRARAPPTTAKA